MLQSVYFTSHLSVQNKLPNKTNNLSENNATIKFPVTVEEHQVAVSNRAQQVEN